MPEPIIITGSAIAAGWKILGSLYEKYQAWSIRKSSSQKTQALRARAEELMNKINFAILSGASSSDQDLTPAIKEFHSLLAQDAKPLGYENTMDWIDRSGKHVIAKVAVKHAAAKRAAAPVKFVAKSPVKKAVAKPTVKKAAAPPKGM